jgi:AraC-like DNA-binding protein
VRYDSRAPRWPLSQFITKLWHAESAEPVVTPRERVLPDGSLQIVIGLGDEPGLKGGVLVGARSEAQEIGASFRALVGVHFKPGGAAPFFAVPVSELEGTAAPLDEVWKKTAPELRDRLAEAPDVPSRFAVLESFLVARGTGRLAQHPATAFALRELEGAEAPSISRIVERTGFSQRHFIEVFRRDVGLAPKVYARIVRFQRALAMIRDGAPLELAQVALVCGYSDQSHFANEFKAISGLTPTQYLGTPGRYGNHVPARGQNSPRRGRRGSGE